MAKSVRVGEIKKINSELFTLTYGSLVAQLIKDYEDDDEVNKQLDKMGYNIGIRLIDDFLARASGIGKCVDFKETADIIAKIGFKMFLGVIPTIANWSADSKEFSLLLEDTAITDFVELPPDHSNLLYSNIICGVLRGALEMVQLKVEVKFVRDILRGDDVTEIRIRLVEMLADEAPPSDE